MHADSVRDEGVVRKLNTVVEEEHGEEEYVENSENHRREKWTWCLLLCCLTASIASFQYGYNVASLNSVTQLTKDFIRNDTFLFAGYHELSVSLVLTERDLLEDEALFNETATIVNKERAEYALCVLTGDTECVARLADDRAARDDSFRQRFGNRTADECVNDIEKRRQAFSRDWRRLVSDGERVERLTEAAWAVTNCLFLVGGLIGALSSKYLLDSLGRKNALLVHNTFTLVGSLAVVLAAAFNMPTLLMLSRLMFGVQGSMSCTLVPIYVAEVSPSSLRGQTGAFHNLLTTVGIVVAQVLGFREILGSLETWWLFLALPAVPAVIGGSLLFLFFPETPKALLLDKRDPETAQRVLQKLRNVQNVRAEMEEISNEWSSIDENANTTAAVEKRVRISELLTSYYYRWPLITVLTMQLAQPLSGIDAVFFYSTDIFADAGIVDAHIQYAILSTGVVNVVAALVCVPLVDSVGRKPLLVCTMIVIVLDYALLVACLSWRTWHELVPYVAVACVVVFVVAFSVALGPIPFIYMTEIMSQSERSSLVSLATFVNYTANLCLTLAFPFMQQFMQQFVFVVFGAVIGAALIVLILKMPETKGKSVDDVMNSFH